MDVDDCEWSSLRTGVRFPASPHKAVLRRLLLFGLARIRLIYFMENAIEIEFTKMTGAGNDFILVDFLSGDINLNWSVIVPMLCNRRYGIGADGLLIICPGKRADFLMEYYNADGSFGGMCGNGGRCAALYAMKKFSRQEIKFEALDYIYRASTNGTNVKLQMKDPLGLYSNRLNLDNEVISFSFIDTGAPHVVILLNDISENLRNQIQSDNFNRIGSQIRYNAMFAPAGANVNFIGIVDNKTISMRTYERGVEEETLACGTGAVASAIVAAITKKIANHYRNNTK